MMNRVAEKLVEHIGEEGYYPMVAMRIDDVMHMITVKDGVAVHTEEPAPTLIEVNALTETIEDNGGVLLLEMLDDEVNPNLRCPTVVSCSLHDLQNTRLKETFKGSHESLLVEEWSAEHTELAARALFAEGYRGLEGDEVHAENDLAVQMLILRDWVGGIMRFMTRKRHIEERLAETKGAVLNDLQLLKNDLMHADIFNVSSLSKLFLSPVYKITEVERINVAPANYEFKLLSPFCTATLVTSLNSEDQLRVLENVVPQHHLEELKLQSMLDGRDDDTITKSAPIESSIATANSTASVLNWLQLTPFPTATKLPLDLEWYKDPGRSVLTAHHLLPPQDVPDYGRFTSIIKFDGGALSMDVASLAECTLYKSTGNTYVGEFFLVRHNIRRVFLFNTSLSKATNHSFNESTVQTIVDGLQLQRNAYKLVIVYVRSNHLDVDCGLRFSVQAFNKNTRKDGTETHTLKEMHAKNKLKEVESYVVRANYYTRNSKIIPQRVIVKSIAILLLSFLTPFFLL